MCSKIVFSVYQKNQNLSKQSSVFWICWFSILNCTPIRTFPVVVFAQIRKKSAFNGDPISYVYPNENGNWKFHQSLEPNLGDAMFVYLEEITKLDPLTNFII